MKPIKLTMSAFGSYSGVERIDFTGIQNGCFLITGDTAGLIMELAGLVGLLTLLFIYNNKYK